jgi:hypothetical protein
MPFSQDLPGGGLRATLCLFYFSLNIREGLGNKMRFENNYSILGRWVSCQVISYAWVRYLNSLIQEVESLEKEFSLFPI